MHRSRFTVAPGIVLDARRAVWLEHEKTLAVADLHLGYAWAHRAAGQMMPLSIKEDTIERLELLVRDYCPRELVILGDVVHRAIRIPALVRTLQDFYEALAPLTTLRLVAGNHDKHLGELLKRAALELPLHAEWSAGRVRCVHGDGGLPAAEAMLQGAQKSGECILIGHEHPALSLPDGPTRIKVPVFLWSSGLLVLPAYSPWAAGSDIQRGQYLSPFLQSNAPDLAIAILAGKLLPVPLRNSMR